MTTLVNLWECNVIGCCIVVIIVLVYILIRTRGGRTEQDDKIAQIDSKIDNLIEGQAQLMDKIDNLIEEIRVGNKELTKSINNLMNEVRADRRKKGKKPD